MTDVRGSRPRSLRTIAAAAWTVLGVLAVAATAAAAPGDPDDAAVQFSRDIRPLLSDKCFRCHGPDEKERKAKLRLDTRDGLFTARKSDAPIVPGDPSASELIRRITSADDDERMPPVDSGKSLAPGDIETIRQWVAEGAEWQGHWSFVQPERPPLPAVSRRDWCRNEIDRFVLARLERERLAPQPEADRRTLIRRVTFDITGLPPTLEEVDAFVADERPEAYEQVVERLLASPRHGEHVAR